MKTIIWGMDLHILKGDVPTVGEGRISGQDGVGIIEEANSSVLKLSPEDHVPLSCNTSYGRCVNCKKGM